MTDQCGGHSGLTGEFRTLLLTAIERAEPVIERLRSEAPAAGAASTCAVCPVCAVLAALRGERTEYAVRLAEHAAELLAVLRLALEEGDPAAARSATPEAPQATTGRRTVQRIPVVRMESRT